MRLWRNYKHRCCLYGEAMDPTKVRGRTRMGGKRWAEMVAPFFLTPATPGPLCCCYLSHLCQAGIQLHWLGLDSLWERQVSSGPLLHAALITPSRGPQGQCSGLSLSVSRLLQGLQEPQALLSRLPMLGTWLRNIFSCGHHETVIQFVSLI